MNHLFPNSLLLGSAALLLAVGCVRETPKERMAFGVPDGKIDYKPVNSGNLELKLLTKPVLYAGEPATLTFALCNNGRKTVKIPEWLSQEQENLLLYVQPWLTGTDRPAPDRWIALTFDAKKPRFHYPLTLMPGNQALISKPLDFIADLQISPGTERRFFLRAESTLGSLKLSTPVLKLYVKPNRIIREKHPVRQPNPNQRGKK